MKTANAAIREARLKIRLNFVRKKRKPKSPPPIANNFPAAKRNFIIPRFFVQRMILYRKKAAKAAVIAAE